MKNRKSLSHIYFLKCQNQECRLEFIVLSWHDNWTDKWQAYCPECGKKQASSTHKSSSEKFIYEIFSGDWVDKLNNE